MFKRLKNKIIILTMTITTVVLVLAGIFIMLFTLRPEPEPKPFPEPSNASSITYDEEFHEYIKSDREEGRNRLFVTLLLVGTTIEITVFLIIYNLAQHIVKPVKDTYDKQKLFIANASHELKTPLAVIEANIEALDIPKKDEKWKNNIENEITHANKLVLDLLQLAKMDAGNIDKITPEDINLKAEIKDHITLFEPKFSGTISFKDNSQSSIYSLPKQDILQLLDILLDNATKYGKKQIIVTLNQNELSITNDGATIKKADQEKVFDRFYQTDKTKPGSGLGLAIAKAICDQNNWQISCESTKNSTKFTVMFSKRH